MENMERDKYSEDTRAAYDFLIKRLEEIFRNKRVMEENIIPEKIKEFIMENSADKDFLEEWYQHSATDDPPVWTDGHIAEVCGDFYLIPKEVVDELK